MNNGIVEACTGVIRLKPMLDTASNIHSARDGVSVPHAREESLCIVFAGGLEDVTAIDGTNRYLLMFLMLLDAGNIIIGFYLSLSSRDLKSTY